MLRNDEILAELEKIRESDADGMLRPRSVVDEAAAPSHPLHTSFEWDDAVCGDAHRLDQARRMIRVVVRYHPQTRKKTRAYFSLSSDRALPGDGEENGTGGSYRSLAEILSSSRMRTSLLEDSLRDMQSFRRRYEDLAEIVEIAEVLRAHDAAISAHGSKKKASKKASKKVTKKKGKKNVDPPESEGGDEDESNGKKKRRGA